MNARTDTQCTYCTHHKVCGKLNRPINIVEAITGFNAVDDNGIDIIVHCIDFESIKPTLRNGSLEQLQNLEIIYKKGEKRMKIIKKGIRPTITKRFICKNCGCIWEAEKGEYNITSYLGMMHDGLKAFNMKCPCCSAFVDAD